MKSKVIVVGGGIAGAGAAYFLSEKYHVTLLESEAHPGYHSTGRSAAVYTENYGTDIVSALVRASRDFLGEPPRGFSDHSLLRPLGQLTIASQGQNSKLDEAWRVAKERIPDCELHSSEFALAKVPILSRDFVAECFWEPRAQDIDVNSLLLGYLRGLKQNGGDVRTNSHVEMVTRCRHEWTVMIAGGDRLHAAVVVNAAGAWAGQVGRLAGGIEIGLQSRRRTAILIGMSPTANSQSWPMTTRLDGKLYFRPFGGELFVSPADATPTPPSDVGPDDVDVAVAMERLHETTSLEIRAIRHRWAGLRSFAPDDIPVVGWDPVAEGLFWLAGQGGSGIKTSPALGMLTASMVSDTPYPAPLTIADNLLATLRPSRFGERPVIAE